MTSPRLLAFLLRHAPALLAFLAASLFAAGLGLHQLAGSRTEILARGQGSAEESRCTLQARNLLAQADTAIRDVVLATTPMEIRQAEVRFEAVDRRYDRTQAALLRLFADDASTSPAEHALLDDLLAERRAMQAPIGHVLELARANDDGPAAGSLVRDVMPRQEKLRALLGDLDAAQQRQDQELAEMANVERAVSVRTTVLLAVLGMLVAGLGAITTRPRWALPRA